MPPSASGSAMQSRSGRGVTISPDAHLKRAKARQGPRLLYALGNDERSQQGSFLVIMPQPVALYAGMATQKDHHDGKQQPIIDDVCAGRYPDIFGDDVAA